MEHVGNAEATMMTIADEYRVKALSEYTLLTWLDSLSKVLPTRERLTSHSSRRLASTSAVSGHNDLGLGTKNTDFEAFVERMPPVQQGACEELCERIPSSQVIVKCD